MTWRVADGHKWSGHIFRDGVSRGNSWSALPNGCEVCVYGARTDAGRAELDELLALLASGVVLEAEPAAVVTVYRTTHNGVTAGAIVATVDAEAVAAFHMGPTHRAAVGRVRGYLNRRSRDWMHERVACRCGDGSCILCDDNGMTPREVAS